MRVMSKPTRTLDVPVASTRDRMVAGAADLLRRRGVAATSLREVVKHTQTPRGSLAHHFPEGKTQLLEEAVAYSRRRVTRQLEQALAGQDAASGLRVFVRQWCQMLESTRFEAGCPVMAVAVEHAGEDAEAEAMSGLLELARAAFDEWADLIAAALRRDGVPRAQARALGLLVVAAFEGGIAMARAARSTQPLEEVARQLGTILAGATTRRRTHAARRTPGRRE